MMSIKNKKLPSQNSEIEMRAASERTYSFPVLASAFLFFCSILLSVIPTLSLVVQYVPKKTYSYWTLLLSPLYQETLPKHNVNLDFSSARLPLLFAVGFPILGFALSLAYPLIRKWLKEKTHFVFLFTAAISIGDLFALFSAQSSLISEQNRIDANMTSESLNMTQMTLGNVAFVLLFLLVIVALIGFFRLQFKMKMLAYPYMLWLIIFTILPLALIFFRAFFCQNASGTGYHFTTAGFTTLMVERTVETHFYGFTLHLQEYFSVFLRSLDYAFWTTIGCLLVTYPLGYALAARTKRKHASSSLLLMFFVLPMWINTMLRTYAWRAFFSQTGVLNNFLMNANFIDSPILFLKSEILSDIIIKLVLINDFLPFMLLPIYSVLVKIDDNVRQAAHDLGANSVQTFLRVIFPLSMPGVISGIQMVFMPSLTFYMIPDIISEGSVTTIGNTVQAFILNESPVYQQAGNVLSLLLLVFLLITMGLLRNQEKDDGGGGLAL